MTRKAERADALSISDAGLVSGISYRASPNCDDRPPDAKVELLVIHAISLPPGEYGGSAIEDLFLNRLDTALHPYYVQLHGLKVSAHFLIRRSGELLQFVPCAKRAWHAGVSSWRGRDRCNDFSVGIELEGSDFSPFEASQYASLVSLTRLLQRNYPIVDVVGHSDIAPARKTDPGPHFNWSHYCAMLHGQ